MPKFWDGRRSRMWLLLLCTVLTAVLVLGPHGRAAEFLYRVDAPFSPPEGRPVVAAALSGGGARALINVGVLRALEEAGVPLDLLVGTSMGAIVALLYGSGLTTAEIETLVTVVDIGAFFDLNVPFFPSLLRGDRFHQALAAVVPADNLDCFPIPAALLSFDLNSGQKYLQLTGPVAEAVQGPYAMPAIFPGAERDGMLLFDAGLTEVVPTAAARELGADIVLATAAFKELPYDRYDTPFRHYNRLLQLIRLDLSGPLLEDYADIVIAVPVNEYSVMDFRRAEFLIDSGYRQAQAQTPEILELLAASGIAPDAPLRTANPHFAAVLDDLVRDRLFYSEPVWQAQVFYGGDHSFFAPRLLPAPPAGLQLGLRLDAGFHVLDVLASRHHMGASWRRKHWSSSWDARLVAAVNRGFGEGAVLLESVQPQYFFRAGFFFQEQLGFGPLVHAGADGPWGRVEGSVVAPAGEPAFWLGWEGRAAISPRLYAAGAVVLSRGSLLPGPRLWSIVTPLADPSWQYRAELQWDLPGERTVNVVELLNLDHWQAFGFWETTVDPGAAGLGVGLRVSAGLFGLKEAALEVSAGYNWTKKRPTARLAVDLRF